MSKTEIIPYLIYRDVPAALDWLARAFGFSETLRVEMPDGGMHAEMALDGRRIMLGQIASAERRKSFGMASPLDVPEHTTSQGVFIYLQDVEAHRDRARTAGARITQDLADHGYGLTYSAKDPEGHDWYFTRLPQA
ncbi:glyoxalase family protein [Acetobacteraceae bacterium AT-5844]|nr:glyoxalase family protein [Acetobacteraceae bacterium AT-5844]